MTRDPIETWMSRWGLVADGPAFAGAAGALAPVRFQGRPAMLKICGSADEVRGARVLAWWRGQGAAEVLAHDGEALLMVRAPAGGPALAEMARSGRDDEAALILCEVVAELHRPRPEPPPFDSPGLDVLFRKLTQRPQPDHRIAKAAETARRLLAEPREAVVLHGDIHHFNVLHFGDAGWKAIDPWGYRGERAYEYANIPRNPDLGLVAAPGRLERLLTLIARRAGLDRDRLRAWTLAHAGLSAVWDLEDGQDPARSLVVLERLGQG